MKSDLVEEVQYTEKDRENAVKIAASIKEKLRNWFTVDQILKKMPFPGGQKPSSEEIDKLLLQLVILGQALVKDFKLKNGNIVRKYKITTDPKDELSLINEDIEDLRVNLSILLSRKREIEELIQSS